MSTAVDDVIEAATVRVLRALYARSAGKNGNHVATASLDTKRLIRSGFNVSFVIRAGGIPGPGEDELKLQPPPRV
jgi:hypothetical protein